MTESPKHLLEHLIELAESYRLFGDYGTKTGDYQEQLRRRSELIGKLVTSLSDEQRELLSNLKPEDIADVRFTDYALRRPKHKTTRKRDVNYKLR